MCFSHIVSTNGDALRCRRFLPKYSTVCVLLQDNCLICLYFVYNNLFPLYINTYALCLVASETDEIHQFWGLLCLSFRIFRKVNTNFKGEKKYYLFDLIKITLSFLFSFKIFPNRFKPFGLTTFRHRLSAIVF